MPSANTKSEKNSTTEASEPLRQAIIIVEHKIRNLEKRKAKLDSYKEAGKPLSRDLQEAVSKYDEVIHHLELSREFVKQFTVIVADTDKAKKRALKKEAAERAASEIAKIKQVLIIQDVLANMGTDAVREDFLAGRNGAVSLTSDDLKYLDDVYSEVSPKHEGPVAFLAQVQKAAEHLLSIVDKRNRELAGTTCAVLQSLITSIIECGYFDQPEPGTVEVEEEEVAADEVEAIPEQLSNETVVDVPILEDAPLVQEPLPTSIPNSTPLHPILQNIVPVSQVESSLFNAQGFQPPNTNPASAANIVPPQAPQLNDVMSRVGGKFTFFQDSELDIADLNGTGQPQQPPCNAPPSAIPSRTFTNQSFNGQPGPAPLGFPAAPNANTYYVGGYQSQAPQHFSQELIQGYPGTGAPPVPQPTNSAATIPLQSQVTNDSPSLGFPPQPEHFPTTFPTQPSNSGPVPPIQINQQSMTNHAPSTDDNIITDVTDVKEAEAATNSTEWASDWSQWDSETLPGKSAGTNKPRGDRNDRDRPPRNNYRGRSNYSNGRSGNRDRESGNNSNNYYNNHNGYQQRGNGEYQRDGKDRNENMNGGYRRGQPSQRGPRPDRGDRSDAGGRPERGDRPDRGDRPPQQGASRSNGGSRPPRTGNRGPSSQNVYRQEQYASK